MIVTERLDTEQLTLGAERETMHVPAEAAGKLHAGVCGS